MNPQHVSVISFHFLISNLVEITSYINSSIIFFKQSTWLLFHTGKTDNQNSLLSSKFI
ncbi:hypothetical protein Bca4012_100849 [Brassica carinata]